MRFYTRPRRTPQVIIVSLIDIFAILLIFVIVTTTFRREQAAVTIKLPEAKSATASEQPVEATELTVKSKDEVYLGKDPVAMDQLVPALQELMARNPNQKLALKAEADVSFQTVLDVFDRLKEAGVQGSLAAFVNQKK